MTHNHNQCLKDDDDDADDAVGFKSCCGGDGRCSCCIWMMSMTKVVKAHRTRLNPIQWGIKRNNTSSAEIGRRVVLLLVVVDLVDPL